MSDNDSPFGLLIWSIVGWLVGKYVRKNTTPQFQRIFFGAVGGVFIVLGAFCIFAGAGIGTGDGANGLLLVVGSSLVLLGWWGIQRNYRRIAASVDQERVLLHHLYLAHSYNGSQLWEQDRRLHIQLHQTTPCTHVHDWQRTMPGPTPGRIQ